MSVKLRFSNKTLKTFLLSKFKFPVLCTFLVTKRRKHLLFEQRDRFSNGEIIAQEIYLLWFRFWSIFSNDFLYDRLVGNCSDLYYACVKDYFECYFGVLSILFAFILQTYYIFSLSVISNFNPPTNAHQMLFENKNTRTHRCVSAIMNAW